MDLWDHHLAILQVSTTNFETVKLILALFSWRYDFRPKTQIFSIYFYLDPPPSPPAPSPNLIITEWQDGTRVQKRYSTVKRNNRSLLVECLIRATNKKVLRDKK